MNEITDEESLEPEAAPAVANPKSGSKGHRLALTNFRRELSEDELKSPGVAKMLMDDIDTLSQELAEVKETAEKFHDADKKLAILQERFKTRMAVEVVSTGAVTVGSLLVGLSARQLLTRSTVDDEQLSQVMTGVASSSGFSWVILIIGCLLLATGIIAKAIKL